MQPVEQLGSDIGLAFEQDRAIHRYAHDQRSDMIFADVVAHLNIEGVGVVQKLRSHPDREELADFFFGRHLAQRLVDPLLSSSVDMDGTGLQKAPLVRVFSKAKRRGQQERDQQQMSEHAIDNSKNGHFL